MIRLFLPTQNVPTWLQSIEFEGGTRSPDLIFGSPVIVFRWKGYYCVYAPLTNFFLRCAMKVFGSGNAIAIKGGGKGVVVCCKLIDVIRWMRDCHD